MANDPRHREIIPLGLDAFYASVETLDNPEIAGKPVIVGGGGKRGVVTAASYEARKFGVHSAQPVATARRLCPDGIFLPVRMGRYKEMSDRVFKSSAPSPPSARRPPTAEPFSTVPERSAFSAALWKSAGRSRR